jgi:hypothetical protein
MDGKTLDREKTKDNDISPSNSQPITQRHMIIDWLATQGFVRLHEDFHCQGLLENQEIFMLSTVNRWFTGDGI